jgi:hypothetical protein
MRHLFLSKLKHMTDHRCEKKNSLKDYLSFIDQTDFQIEKKVGGAKSAC